MNHNDPFELYDEKRVPSLVDQKYLDSNWRYFIRMYRFLRPEFIFNAIVQRWEYGFIKDHYKEYIGGDDEGII